MTEEHKQIAERLIEYERGLFDLVHVTAAIIVSKGNYFIGSVRSIIPEEPEIVLCAHSSYKVDKGLIDAIQELSPRPELTVDDDLELAHRQDILRRVENRLTIMTPVQTRLAAEFLMKYNIIEI